MKVLISCLVILCTCIVSAQQVPSSYGAPAVNTVQSNDNFETERAKNAVNQANSVVFNTNNLSIQRGGTF